MEIKVGTKVKYVPDEAYWLDKDAGGDFCFELFERKNNKPYDGPKLAPGGRRMLPMLPAIALRPGKPKYHWDAEVTAVYPDGSAALKIHHPRGTHKLFHSRVRQSTRFEPNSWYLLVQEQAVKEEYTKVQEEATTQEEKA